MINKLVPSKAPLASSLPRGSKPIRICFGPVRITIKTLRRGRQRQRNCRGLLESDIVWDLREVLVLTGSAASNYIITFAAISAEQGHIAGKTHIYRSSEDPGGICECDLTVMRAKLHKATHTRSSTENEVTPRQPLRLYQRYPSQELSGNSVCEVTCTLGSSSRRG